MGKKKQAKDGDFIIKGSKKENGKDHMFRVRLDAETLQKLDELAHRLNLSRSEVVRQAIEQQHAKT